MKDESQAIENLGDFLKRLEWQDYEFVQQPELPHGVSPQSKITPKNQAKLEAYRLQRVKWRQCMESITPGTVLFLKTGKFVLVGHVNESLTSKENYEPDFEYEDICKIAKLW
jgi:hypothetical protein